MTPSGRLTSYWKDSRDQAEDSQRIEEKDKEVLFQKLRWEQKAAV